jgi:hypothetical protein
MVENIRHFVMPLRAEHLTDPSPIVILHDQELTGKQWQQLSFFTQIYYVIILITNLIGQGVAFE